MALCVIVNELNQLIATTTPISECSSYVLQESADFLAHSLFQIPDMLTLQGFWMAGFFIPMVSHVIAWAVGSLVNFFNKE